MINSGALLGRGSSYNLVYDGLRITEVGVADESYNRLKDNPELIKRYLQRAEPETFWDFLSIFFDIPCGRRARLFGARLEQLRTDEG